MMKKLSLFLLTLLLTICLISCNADIQPVIPTPTPAPSEAPKLVDNIAFRRGETIEGELLFTGEVLQEVYVTTTPGTSEYALSLIFTQEGATLLEQYSKELVSSKEKLSLWIGEEQIFAAKFAEKITGGQMQLTGNLSSEKVYELYNKFYGIQS